MLGKVVSCLLILLILSHEVHAEVWDWHCESAIGKLKDAQEDISSAKEDIDSAKFTYQLCTPSRYDNCEFERLSLDNAIDEYNSAIDDFESALSSFKNSCLD